MERKIKVVIAVSSFEKNSIYETIQNSNPNVHFIFRLVKNKNWSDYDFSRFSNKIDVILEENITFELEDFANDYTLVDLIHEVLNDHQTYLFADREGLNRSYGLGVNNYTRFVTNLVVKNYIFYKKHSPDISYFRSSPHVCNSWVNALVAEKMGVIVLVGVSNELSNRRYLMKGFRRNRQFCEFTEDICRVNYAKEIQHVNKILSNKKSSYSDAIPYYEKERLERNDGRLFNLRKEIFRSWRKPHLLYNKYRCYNEYIKLQKIPIEEEKYIIFFMQYQPERTSLPESYGFAQQLIAIYALRIATPNDITIFVKEHPSTFTNQCDPFQRHPSFYREISQLMNVKLLSLQLDNFKAIDHAIVIATLTGNVGVEALIRGKPAIYFGTTIVSSTYGVEKYTTLPKLEGFIFKCISLHFCPEKISKASEVSIIQNFRYSVPGTSNYDRTETNKQKRLKAEEIILNELFNFRVKIPDFTYT